MTDAKEHNLTLSESAGPILSAGVLQNVAQRLRGEGLFVAMLNRAGEIACHDLVATPFHEQYTLPCLRSAVAMLADAAQSITANSGVVTVPPLAGLTAVMAPFVEKKQVQGILLIAARSRTFTNSPNVTRECSRLGIEYARIMAHAVPVPGFDSDSLAAQARIAMGMVRDQIRLVSLEKELNSLSTQLANSYEELSLIYQVSGGMKINRSPADFFKQVCLDVREVSNTRAMGVVLCGEGSCRQVPALFGDIEMQAVQLSRLADELMHLLRDRKSPVLINDLRADRQFNWVGEFASQLIAVPLQRQDQVLGCLFGFDKTTGDFDSVDSKLVNSIANEAAIYLENAGLFEDVRDLMMGILHSLTSAVDAKDAYTCGHSERVALLSRRLAMEISLPFHQVERIYMAGILHDVGKIGVPEAVLQKTGKLTNEEFEQMKKHPEIGARILQDIKQVADIIPGVLHHHERYDGRGYPHKLSGQNIPLMGRIICLADCFDAMTSNRTYRRALPLEVALIEMRRCAGTQFDPQLAEAFLRITPEEFRGLMREHQNFARQRSTEALPLVKAA